VDRDERTPRARSRNRIVTSHNTSQRCARPPRRRGPAGRRTPPAPDPGGHRRTPPDNAPVRTAGPSRHTPPILKPPASAPEDAHRTLCYPPPGTGCAYPPRSTFPAPRCPGGAYLAPICRPPCPPCACRPPCLPCACRPPCPPRACRPIPLRRPGAGRRTPCACSPPCARPHPAPARGWAWCSPVAWSPPTAPRHPRRARQPTTTIASPHAHPHFHAPTPSTPTRASRKLDAFNKRNRRDVSEKRSRGEVPQRRSRFPLHPKGPTYRAVDIAHRRRARFGGVSARDHAGLERVVFVVRW
jgi:hypothetical protein